MYNFSLFILIIVLFRVAANQIVYNEDSASLYFVNAPVIEGNASELNDYNGSFNTSLFTKNTSWVTLDEYENFVNQSVSIHKLEMSIVLLTQPMLLLRKIILLPISPAIRPICSLDRMFFIDIIRRLPSITLEQSIREYLGYAMW